MMGTCNTDSVKVVFNFIQWFWRIRDGSPVLQKEIQTDRQHLYHYLPPTIQVGGLNKLKMSLSSCKWHFDSIQN